MSEHLAAVLDPDGVVVNLVVVDPDQDYYPGEGLTLHQLGDDEHPAIGATLDGGTWTEPAPTPEPSPDPRDAALADLQHAVDYLIARDLEEA